MGEAATALALPRREPDRAEGRQGEENGMRLPVPRDGLARDAPAVADIAAAIDGAVAVEDLAVEAGLGHPDAVPVPWHRGEVADAQGETPAIAGEAGEGHDTLHGGATVHPREAVRLAVPLMKGGL